MRINLKRGGWNFADNVPKKFNVHIQKSVPYYEEGHELIKKLSDFFLTNKSICYDIGCSTSSLLIKLSKFSNKKDLQFVGLDVEKAMIKFSKKIIKRKKVNNVKVLCKDITKYKFKKCSLIISYYTIQFVNPAYRQKLIDEIFDALNWGGAFIFFEKIRGNDARFQDILTSLYSDFKEQNNIPSSDILKKTKSIRGVLEPYSNFGNKSYLKRAGFKDVQTIFQYLCFKGYLCIK